MKGSLKGYSGGCLPFPLSRLHGNDFEVQGCLARLFAADDGANMNACLERTFSKP